VSFGDVVSMDTDLLRQCLGDGAGARWVGVEHWQRPVEAAVPGRLCGQGCERTESPGSAVPEPEPARALAARPLRGSCPAVRTAARCGRRAPVPRAGAPPCQRLGDGQ